MHEALQYEKTADNLVNCSLCSHRCRIKEGSFGICGVRQNRAGVLYATTYGRISAEAVDPIEKNRSITSFPGRAHILSAVSGAIFIASTARTGIFRDPVSTMPC